MIHNWVSMTLGHWTRIEKPNYKIILVSPHIEHCHVLLFSLWAYQVSKEKESQFYGLPFEQVVASMY